MAFVTPNTPNLTDFTTYLQDNVQIPTSALPTNSAFIGYALNGALGMVPGGQVTGQSQTTFSLPPVPPVLFTIAVYNCATHLLFVIAPDQPGQTFFSYRRSKQGYGLDLPSSGLVVSASDQGTSSSVAQPEWASRMTVGQLGFMKTPWGREYLSWIQSFGPTPWGLT